MVRTLCYLFLDVFIPPVLLFFYLFHHILVIFISCYLPSVHRDIDYFSPFFFLLSFFLSYLLVQEIIFVDLRTEKMAIDCLDGYQYCHVLVLFLLVSLTHALGALSLIPLFRKCIRQGRDDILIVIASISPRPPSYHASRSICLIGCKVI